jgi:glycosyltransferase involved in cell wall biosynthesis
MRIAFYAPLKPPDHPTPSGDRRMAQLFLAALRLAGHEPVLVSRFRSYEGSGNPVRQARLAALGRRVAERHLRHWRGAPEQAPELWFSYHIYHKAPDWLGPAVAVELGIPYIVAEASVTPRQALGSWALGHHAAECAIQQAAAVIGVNPSDRECVLPLLGDPRRWVAFKPFLDAASFARNARHKSDQLRLITVAMMRDGDKLASYQILGDALSQLVDLPWSLEVLGDGAAREEVESALALFRERVTWTGSLSQTDVTERLAVADLFLWPAVNEAFGMALLEAQASGLPVVAGSAGGVAEIVVSGTTGLLVAPGDACAFAAAVRSLILDRSRRSAFGAAARRRVLREHDLPPAARRLASVIGALSRPMPRDLSYAR